jgi:iron complex transport system substrate-binding protein
MLFALGLGDQTIGVTHECDFPPAAAELPRLTATVMPAGLPAGEIDAAVKRIVGEGRALYSLDEGRLAALAPDLIVTQAVCEVCAVSYEDVVRVAARLPGPPRVLQQDPSSLGEVLADLTRLGEAAGVDAHAAAVRAGLEERLAAVRAAVAGASPPRVVTLEWLDPPYVGGHWVPEMVELVGAVDVAGPRGAPSRPRSPGIASPGCAPRRSSSCPAG